MVGAGVQKHGATEPNPYQPMSPPGDSTAQDGPTESNPTKPISPSGGSIASSNGVAFDAAAISQEAGGPSATLGTVVPSSAEVRAAVVRAEQVGAFVGLVLLFGLYRWHKRKAKAEAGRGKARVQQDDVDDMDDLHSNLFLMPPSRA